MKLCGICGDNAMWSSECEYHISKVTGRRLRCPDAPLSQEQLPAAAGETPTPQYCPTCKDNWCCGDPWHDEGPVRAESAPRDAQGCGHQLTEYEHNYYANRSGLYRLCKRCAMEAR